MINAEKVKVAKSEEGNISPTTTGESSVEGFALICRIPLAKLSQASQSILILNTNRSEERECPDQEGEVMDDSNARPYSSERVSAKATGTSSNSVVEDKNDEREMKRLSNEPRLPISHRIGSRNTQLTLFQLSQGVLDEGTGRVEHFQAVVDMRGFKNDQIHLKLHGHQLVIDGYREVLQSSTLRTEEGPDLAFENDTPSNSEHVPLKISLSTLMQTLTSTLGTHSSLKGNALDQSTPEGVEPSTSQIYTFVDTSGSAKDIRPSQSKERKTKREVTESDDSSQSSSESNSKSNSDDYSDDSSSDDYSDDSSSDDYSDDSNETESELVKKREKIRLPNSKPYKPIVAGNSGVTRRVGRPAVTPSSIKYYCNFEGCTCYYTTQKNLNAHQRVKNHRADMEQEVYECEHCKKRDFKHKGAYSTHKLYCLVNNVKDSHVTSKKLEGRPVLIPQTELTHASDVEIEGTEEKVESAIIVRRKLVVDEETNFLREQMKPNLSGCSDILTTLNLAPPTKRLMYLREKGGVETLFARSGRNIPSCKLLKLVNTKEGYSRRGVVDEEGEEESPRRKVSKACVSNLNVRFPATKGKPFRPWEDQRPKAKAKEKEHVSISEAPPTLATDFVDESESSLCETEPLDLCMKDLFVAGNESSGWKPEVGLSTDSTQFDFDQSNCVPYPIYPICISNDVEDENADMELLPIAGAGLRAAHIRSLEGTNLLNDAIIHFAIRDVLTRLGLGENTSVFSFDPFFYEELAREPKYKNNEVVVPPAGTAEQRHKRVERWTRRVDLFEKEFIIVPLHDRKNEHWSLAIICSPGGVSSLAVANGENTVESKLNNGSEFILPHSCPMEGELEMQPCIMIFDSIEGNPHDLHYLYLREYLRVEFQVSILFCFLTNMTLFLTRLVRGRILPNVTGPRSASLKNWPISTQPEVVCRLDEIANWLIRFYRKR